MPTESLSRFVIPSEGMEEGFLDVEKFLLPTFAAASDPRMRFYAQSPIGQLEEDAVLMETTAIPAGAVLEEFEDVAAGAAESTDFEINGPAEENARAEFPQVLFYGMVPVSGAKEVVIPVGDALATYAVEVFALADGDWVEACESVIVDKPVRIDLELPPAVALEDDVTGRLRAVTSSGKARISLTRDGEAVLFPGSDEPVIDTPKQIEFPVKPGTYLARVEDVSTGEVDSVEVWVGTPGRFKFYARELALLQSGEALTLESADTLTLRVLPAVDEPLQGLLTATAGYGSRHAVAQRAELAYAAASFLALGQLTLGIRIANQVTRQLNEQGRLYSTVDSVAAIVLMIQLRTVQLASGDGRIRVNGKEMSCRFPKQPSSAIKWNRSKSWRVLRRWK